MDMVKQKGRKTMLKQSANPDLGSEEEKADIYT